MTMRQLEGHTKYVECVAFAPDGKLLGTGSADGTARLWDTTAGKHLHSLDFEGSTVGAVAFAPEGGQLAVGTYAGTVGTYEVGGAGKPTRIREWEGQGRIVSVTYSADGRYFGWASYHRVVVSPRAGGDETAVSEPTNNVFCMRFAPDGESLARGGESPAVQICESGTQRVKHRLSHKDKQGCWSLAYSADGKALVLALGGGMQVWDVAARKRVQEVKDHGEVVSCIALSADGTRLITGSWDDVVRVYSFDAATRRVGKLIGDYDWGLGKVFDVALSPDGTLAAVAGHDGAALWDVE